MLQGGRPVAKPVFRVNISVPEGALSDRRKQELVSEATRVISEAAGLTDQDGLRVWVIIRDVPEGNWGAAGNIVHFEQLRQAAAQTDGGERQAMAAEQGAPAATSA